MRTVISLSMMSDIFRFNKKIRRAKTIVEEKMLSEEIRGLSFQFRKKSRGSTWRAIEK